MTTEYVGMTQDPKVTVKEEHFEFDDDASQPEVLVECGNSEGSISQMSSPMRRMSGDSLPLSDALTPQDPEGINTLAPSVSTDILNERTVQNHVAKQVTVSPPIISPPSFMPKLEMNTGKEQHWTKKNVSILVRWGWVVW